MATVNTTTANIHGLVAFADNTIEHIGSELRENGTLISQTNNDELFKQLYHYYPTIITSLFNQIGISILGITTPTTQRPINDFIINIYGTITYIDGSTSTFGSQYTPSTGVLNTNTNTILQLTNAASDNTFDIAMSTLVRSAIGTDTNITLEYNIFTDNFDRTDGPLGDNWQVAPWVESVEFPEDIPEIVDGKFALTIEESESYEMILAQTPTRQNHYAEITIDLPQLTDEITIGLRPSTFGSYPSLNIKHSDPIGSPPQGIYIIMDIGQQSTPTPGMGPYANGSTVRFDLEVNPDQSVTGKAYVNGTLIETIINTNKTVYGTGSPLIWLAGTAKVDNFETNCYL